MVLLIMASVKVIALLLLVKWVHLCSTLSDECLFYMEEEQDYSVMPVDITCATFLNGTLNTWWTVEDSSVELVTLDYNCTGFGEDQAENLYLWVQGPRGETVADRVDLRPNASSDSFNSDPTCYVDGCFVWFTGRGSHSTLVIPTVTCDLSTTSQTTSLDWSSSVVTVTSVTTATTDHTEATPPQPISGGLKSHIWFMLILVPLLVTVLCIPFLIHWRVKRKRQRRWWLNGNNRDKNLLLGNEPCIDPMGRVKNDYLETITIVDPLDFPEQVQPGLRITTIIPVENHFIQDFNQQAGESDSHSLNGSGSSGNENISIQVGPASGGDVGNDSSSACTQTVENGEDTEAQQSDSEEERMLTSNFITNFKGTSKHIRPTSLNLQKNCPPSTKRDKSSRIQISNQVALSTEPAKVVTTSTSECEKSGGSASSQDKICSNDIPKELSCAELSPKHGGLSMHGELLENTNGTSVRVRPTSLKLRKLSPPSTERDEVSHPNQTVMNSNTKGASARPRPTTLYLRKLRPSSTEKDELLHTINSNTKGASARPRPTTLNLQKLCLSSTERDELSHPGQIVINSNTKGASARPRPTTLYLRKLCPSSTEKDERSHPNQIVINSNTKGTSACRRPTTLYLRKLCPSSMEKDELSQTMNSNTKGTSAHSRPTTLNLRKLSPSSTERDELSSPNQIQDNVVSCPGPAKVVILSTTIHGRSGGGSASILPASANPTNESVSLDIGSSPVTEQVYKNVNSEESKHTSAAVRSSNYGPLYTIPEDDQTRYQSSPSYISSSECTSSVYSSARGANCGVGYLADIEDMDSTSMQSNLESDEEAGDEMCVVHVERENRSECEPGHIQLEILEQLLQQCNKNPHQPHNFLSNESDDDFEYLYIATVPEIELPDSPCNQYIGTLPIRTLGESDDDFEYLYIATIPEIEVPDTQCSENTDTLPLRVLSGDDDFEYLYIARYPELPDSPCSVNFDTLPPEVELSQLQDDVNRFGLANEGTAQPVEYTDTPNSGYISSDPQNEIRDDVQRYQHETTV